MGFDLNVFIRQGFDFEIQYPVKSQLSEFSKTDNQKKAKFILN